MSIRKVKEEAPFFSLFDRFIQDCKTGKRVQANGRILSKGTIRNYENCRRLLNDFCSTKGFFLRIKAINRLNARELLTEKNYWAKFYKKFTDYLYRDLENYDNYVGSVIKIIRAFFNYLQKDLLINTGNFYQKFYVIREDIPVITLMPEELNYLIFNQDFENSLSKRLKEVKDVFVFGCTVALQFNDLLGLKESNLRITGNVWFLVVRSQKSRIESMVRLPDYAIDIIKRYFKGHGYLLPRKFKNGMNKYIKQLAEKAGFIQMLEKQRSKRGEYKRIGKENAIRFCEAISNHTMRRTAITVMLSLGMPEQIVRKISGHAPASREFYRYVAIAQNYQDKETGKMFLRLKNVHST